MLLNKSNSSMNEQEFVELLKLIEELDLIFVNININN